jgi:hypothetical protein
MSKPLHPVDIRDRERIASAVRFNVHQRRGPHTKINEPAATLFEAADIAERISAGAGGKPCLVYGILPNNSAVMVPQDMVEAAKAAGEPAPQSEVQISRSEIEQLSAILSGGDKKRANTKDAAVNRFLNLAAEKGVDNPHDFLAGPFADVAGRLRDRLAPKAEAAPEIGNAAARKAAIDALAPAKADDYPAPAEKPAKVAKPASKKAAMLEAAERGELPAAPDFSAETHRRYRAKLAELVALAEAGKIEDLRAYPINPISSSPQAMNRYRNLCVVALEARQDQKEA